MYAFRSNQATIERSIEGPFITAILGPRRVGKSTLTQQFSENHSEYSWVFLNMDIEEQRLDMEAGKLLQRIEKTLRHRVDDKKKSWVVIDEAQKCPKLFDQIKILYDQYKKKNVIKFILTGSGYLSLHQLSAETLAGRIEIYYLNEFTIQESVRLKHSIDMPFYSFIESIVFKKDLPGLIQMKREFEPFQDLLEQSIDEQLIWGGLPEVIAELNDERKLEYLSNYLQTYLEKDIRGITTINDLHLYRELIKITAEQTGSIRDDKKTMDALSCSRDTLKKYRGYLKATLVYDELYPYIGSSLKRLTKSPKGYLLNNGIISYLTGVDNIPLLKSTGLIGHRFENWILRELQIALARNPRQQELYFWRTSSGSEIDFIIEAKPFLYPVEVTYSTQTKRNKIRCLQNFLQEEPKANYGIYLYMGELEIDEKNKIIFLPAWLLG